MSTEILLISDLHLSPEQPATVQRFLHFTRERARQARDLYILGDLFDAWIGDDNDAFPYGEIRNSLSELVQSGTAVYLQHGNRDFLLGEVFCKQTGCMLIADEEVRDFFGTPTLLMHGDTLCTDDVAYQQARQLLRSKAFITDFLKKPLQERALIAAEYRKKSGEATSLLAAEIMDVNQQAVTDVMRKHAVCRLVHGHTHREAIHQLEIDGRTCERIVLGEWHPDHGMALSVSATGINALVV
ncbi:MAG: UDP-2,3-diacylglucosamine diphosphatase [Gammaproteobacteria bacterium]